MDGSEETAEKQDKQPWLKPYRWPKGVSGNPDGRPPGTISPVEKIRSLFRENPEDFEEFLTAYLRNPQNHKHVMEMLEGKPMQKVDHSTLGKELPQPIINVLTHQRNEEGDGDEETNTGDTGGNVS